MTKAGVWTGDKNKNISNDDGDMNPTFNANRPFTVSDASTGADAYDQFEATELYCPKCRQAVPVRKRLLLILPEGDKYEYTCSYCAGSVGAKLDRTRKPLSIIG